MKLVFLVPFDPEPQQGLGRITLPPIRLACLAALGRSLGHEVLVVDGVGLGFGHRWVWRERFWLHGLDIEQNLAQVPEDADVIGVSLMFSAAYPPTRDLLRRLRERHPRALLLVGGEGCTGVADQVLQESGADAVVVGEGEGPLARILEAHARGGLIDGIPNVVTARHPSARARDMKDKGAFASLDALPRPDWDGIPLEAYWGSSCVQGVTVAPRFMPMLASRGCPFKCRFCAAPGTWGGQRYASVEEVIGQMCEHIERYDLRFFIFADLSLTTNLRWFEAFVDALLLADLGVRWSVPSGIRAQRLSVDLLTRAKRAGLIYLQVSPETGSPRIMRWLDKAMRLEDIEATVRNAKLADLTVSAQFIVGHPVEKWHDYLDTLTFMARLSDLGLDETWVTIFLPVPGSPSFDEAVAAGTLRTDDEYFATVFLNDVRARWTYNPNFSGEELQAMRTFACLWFYAWRFGRSPEQLLGSMRRAAAGEQTQRLDRILRHEMGNVARMLVPLATVSSLKLLGRLLPELPSMLRTLRAEVTAATPVAPKPERRPARHSLPLAAREP